MLSQSSSIFYPPFMHSFHSSQQSKQLYMKLKMQRSNGSPACASCRHQRKRCTENCVLARFFPAEKTREFQAVHKVFGVSNVTKILKDLNVEDGKRAVDSLIWEAFCRLKDPVLGPYGEYRRVYEELKLYKSQYQQQQIFQHQFQGGVGLMGWNVSNNKGMNNVIGVGGINNDIINSRVLEYSSNNNSDQGVIEDSRPPPYTGFSSMENMEKVVRQENGSANVLPHQQHSVNGFNEQFY